MADATKSVDKRPIVMKSAGGLRERYPVVTFAGNYRTGGVALSAADLGLKGIRYIAFEPVVGNTAGDDTDVDNINFYALYNRATGKVQLIVASSGVELADNKAIDSTVLYGFVIGY